MVTFDSFYKKFVIMQSRGVRMFFLYEIFFLLQYYGIECVLWFSFYYSIFMCKSLIQDRSNRVSGKISFIYKVLLLVCDYSFNFEFLQYQYNRWFFKTIIGVINFFRFSGCSLNVVFQQKFFFVIYWQWQYFYFVDVVRQYSNLFFFLTVSFYEWSFFWFVFIKDLWEEYFL